VVTSKRQMDAFRTVLACQFLPPEHWEVQTTSAFSPPRTIKAGARKLSTGETLVDNGLKTTLHSRSPLLRISLAESLKSIVFRGVIKGGFRAST